MHFHEIPTFGLTTSSPGTEPSKPFIGRLAVVNSSMSKSSTYVPLSLVPVPSMRLMLSGAGIVEQRGASLPLPRPSAMHHYFRSFCPFIKTPWVRTLSLSTFSHFLKLSAERFETINIAKGEDDGTVFRLFIRESRLRADRRGLSTGAIVEVLDKGKFIPFCSKDPIMAQFPLALSIEPRLLPLAIANGLRMDSRYRDFVFRRIFQRTDEHSVVDVLLNVRELCRLDTSMFVSRTVAAEVLMEAETNDAGYAALKTLDREGDLRFSLATLVEDLVKSFVKTYSIAAASTRTSLRYLWKDFPSRNPTARLVMLLTVFIGSSTVDTLHSDLERLNLTPVSTEDLTRVLVSPTVEHFYHILCYARAHCEIRDEKIFSSFLANVAVTCLEVASKVLFQQLSIIQRLTRILVSRETCFVICVRNIHSSRMKSKLRPLLNIG
ncbi:hypothetical protein BGW80DRAFT_484395 [Lactifluus volemus]|nr:hypothetical protein BGW80DRAFT_484395 [Lactifluus volemus]